MHLSFLKKLTKECIGGEIVQVELKVTIITKCGIVEDKCCTEKECLVCT